MLLHITFDDLKTFSYQTPDLEKHFDFLSGLIANGLTVKSALLISSNGSRVELPLEAFDGKPIGNPIKALQLEYKKILHLAGIKHESRRVNEVQKDVEYAIEKIGHLKKSRSELRQKAFALFERLDDIAGRIQALK
ncbi:hypothetical protein GCM10027347_60690 [Larkinella harenae]